MTSAIDIFRSGTHTDMRGRTLSFNDADLAAAAAAYDPELHEAPLVVGHPAHDQPAYGWVKGLRFADGALSAEPDQVDPAFAELVREGRFKKISASFYLPDAPGNPKPGAYYLRHVGFLGAQPPAVKGLRPVQFAAGDEGVAVFGDFGDRLLARLVRGLREFLIEKFGAEDAERVLPAMDVDLLQEEAAPPAAESAAAPAFADPPPEPTNPAAADNPKETPPMEPTPEQRTAELAEKDKALSEREAQLTAREAAAQRQAGAAAFVEGLVTEGRVLPKDKAPLTAFLAGLPEEQVVAFGEGDARTEQPAGTYLRGFLSGLPKQVELAEQGGGDEPPEAATDPAAIAREAAAYVEAQRANGQHISIVEAVQHITKGQQA